MPTLEPMAVGTNSAATIMSLFAVVVVVVPNTK